MPTTIKESGFRLFFYSNELDEKVHVHVQYQSAVAKFWLKPVSLAINYGMKPHELRRAFDLVIKYQNLIEEKPQVKKVYFIRNMLCVLLEDGREIRVPLEYYPRLKNATAKQRKNYQIIGNGTGIHWPDIDEDLSVEAIIEGQPSRF
jgi:hypothetical protein